MSLDFVQTFKICGKFQTARMMGRQFRSDMNGWWLVCLIAMSVREGSYVVNFFNSYVSGKTIHTSLLEDLLQWMRDSYHTV